MRWEHHLEEKGQPTLLNLALFENGIFKHGVEIASIQTMMIAGVLFTVPLFLQVTYGLNPLQSGFYLLPLSIAVLIFALLGVRLGQAYVDAIGHASWMAHCDIERSDLASKNGRR